MHRMQAAEVEGEGGEQVITGTDRMQDETSSARNIRYYDEYLTRPDANPRVAFAYLKYLWHSGERAVAYSKLEQFTMNVEKNKDVALLAR